MFLFSSFHLLARPNIICMVAGIAYVGEPVRSGIHSTSVIAKVRLAGERHWDFEPSGIARSDCIGRKGGKTRPSQPPNLTDVTLLLP